MFRTPLFAGCLLFVLPMVACVPGTPVEEPPRGAHDGGTAGTDGGAGADALATGPCASNPCADEAQGDGKLLCQEADAGFECLCLPKFYDTAADGSCTLKTTVVDLAANQPDFSDPEATFQPRFKVVDPLNYPVAGAAVTVGERTVTSTADGSAPFFVGVVAGKNHLVTVVKEGYATLKRIFEYATAGERDMTLKLAPIEAVVAFDSQAGAAVESATTSLSIPHNAFLNADGTGFVGEARVELAGIPAEDNVVFENVPGLPFGVVDGRTVPIQMGAVLYARVTDAASGNELVLSPSQRVEARLLLAADFGAAAGDVVPLLRLDEATGLWKAESVCVVEAAPAARQTATQTLECRGSVSHLSYWAPSLVRLGELGTNPRWYCVTPKQRVTVGARFDLPADGTTFTINRCSEADHGANGDSCPPSDERAGLRFLGSFLVLANDETASWKWDLQTTFEVTDRTSGQKKDLIHSHTIDRAGLTEVTGQVNDLIAQGSDNPLALLIELQGCDDLNLDIDLTALDEGLVDRDNDGYYAPKEGPATKPWHDCDDTRSFIHPGADELACDGYDTDCDGETDLANPGWQDVPNAEAWNKVYCDYRPAMTGVDLEPGSNVVHVSDLWNSEKCWVRDNLETSFEGASVGDWLNVGSLTYDYPSSAMPCDSGWKLISVGEEDYRFLKTDSGWRVEVSFGISPFCTPSASGDICFIPGQTFAYTAADSLTVAGESASSCVEIAAAEVNGNAYDENCDGLVVDRDNDGYVSEDWPVGTAIPTGLTAGDCDDTNPDVHPGAAEVIGDHLDNDCDHKAPDADGDGYADPRHAPMDGVPAESFGDCNDGDDDIFPGAPIPPTGEGRFGRFFYEHTDGKVHRQAEFCAQFDTEGKPTVTAKATLFADYNCDGFSSDLDGDGWTVPGDRSLEARFGGQRRDFDCNDFDPRIKPDPDTLDAEGNPTCAVPTDLVNDTICTPEPVLSRAEQGLATACPTSPAGDETVCVDLMDNSDPPEPWGEFICSMRATGHEVVDPINKEPGPWGPCDFNEPQLPACPDGYRCAGPLTYSLATLQYLRDHHGAELAGVPWKGMCQPLCGNLCTAAPCSGTAGASCIYTKGDEAVPGGTGSDSTYECVCPDGTTLHEDRCVVCVNGTTRECYTGPEGTAGVGLCAKGNQTCANNVWPAADVCDGEVLPAEDTGGNGDDEDCDGSDAPDTTPPAPDPPAVTISSGDCELVHGQTTASDPSGVKTVWAFCPPPHTYNGADGSCTDGGGADAWQETAWVTGEDPRFDLNFQGGCNLCEGQKSVWVKARSRDQSPLHNQTGWSDPVEHTLDSGSGADCCAGRQTWEGSVCSACPDKSTLNESTNTCLCNGESGRSAEGSSSWNADSSTCECPYNQAWNDSGACACPEHSSWPADCIDIASSCRDTPEPEKCTLCLKVGGSFMFGVGVGGGYCDCRNSVISPATERCPNPSWTECKCQCEGRTEARVVDEVNTCACPSGTAWNDTSSRCECKDSGATWSTETNSCVCSGATEEMNSDGDCVCATGYDGDPCTEQKKDCDSAPLYGQEAPAPTVAVARFLAPLGIALLATTVWAVGTRRRRNQR